MEAHKEEEKFFYVKAYDEYLNELNFSVFSATETELANYTDASEYWLRHHDPSYGDSEVMECRELTEEVSWEMYFDTIKEAVEYGKKIENKNENERVFLYSIKDSKLNDLKSFDEI